MESRAKPRQCVHLQDAFYTLRYLPFRFTTRRDLSRSPATLSLTVSHRLHRRDTGLSHGRYRAPRGERFRAQRRFRARQPPKGMCCPGAQLTSSYLHVQVSEQSGGIPSNYGLYAKQCRQAAEPTEAHAHGRHARSEWNFSAIPGAENISVISFTHSTIKRIGYHRD